MSSEPITLSFVTSSRLKAEDMRAIAQSVGWTLEIVFCEMPELQLEYPALILEKLRYARSIVDGPVMVDDFEMRMGTTGFPGYATKAIYRQLGVTGLVALAKADPSLERVRLVCHLAASIHGQTSLASGVTNGVLPASTATEDDGNRRLSEIVVNATDGKPVLSVHRQRAFGALVAQLGNIDV